MFHIIRVATCDLLELLAFPERRNAKIKLVYCNRSAYVYTLLEKKTYARYIQCYARKRSLQRSALSVLLLHRYGR